MSCSVRCVCIDRFDDGFVECCCNNASLSDDRLPVELFRHHCRHNCLCEPWQIFRSVHARGIPVDYIQRFDSLFSDRLLLLLLLLLLSFSLPFVAHLRNLADSKWIRAQQMKWGKFKWFVQCWTLILASVDVQSIRQIKMHVIHLRFISFSLFFSYAFRWKETIWKTTSYETNQRKAKTKKQKTS